MNIAAYLQRIAYRGSQTPSADTLRALHLAHLHAVPFENLDIHMRRPISLEPACMFQKIVIERRGGFCYELNGLFAALLQALGFQVAYLAASDAHADGGYGPPFDHLALLVEVPQEGHTRWLADVGWGDTFCRPLRADTAELQVEGARAYRLERDGEYSILWQRHASGEWERNYRFSLEPRQFTEFESMCGYHQTSADSPFTRNRLVTRATPNGRITLDDRRLIMTVDSQRTETPIEGEDMFWRLAQEHFGIAARH
ncbi:MAG TPA: arylamine N-acetyltransferase [Roseiflexaceae bacterium]|nr:arylamine N-acetyltransferase [Roseiflexaceae bacterium]